MTRTESPRSQLIADAKRALTVSPRAAIAIAEQLLRRSPADDEAWLILGNAGLQAGEFEVAVRAFQTLHDRHPDAEPLRRGLGMALNSRGAQRRKSGDEHNALLDFAFAIQVFPAHPQAAFNAALCATALGNRSESRRWLDHHLAHQPEDREAQWLWFDSIDTARLDTAQLQRWQHLLRQPFDGVDGALRTRVLARFGPRDLVLDAWAACDASQRSRIGFGVGDQLRQRNETDAARRIFSATAASAEKPSVRTLLAAAMTMPVLPDSAAQIAECRAAAGHALGDLGERLRDRDVDDLRLQDLAWSNFYLAYHGADDLPLQSAYARLLQDLTARAWPAWQQAPTGRRARKVVMLSSFWRDCTVGSYFAGWIDWLRAADFEVVVYQLGPQRDEVTERTFARASRGVFWDESQSLESLVEAIRDEQATLLIYPELGMDGRIFPLAALRLARRQVVAWGHPVTTGFQTLDGYFTCADMEPDHASTHYSERLLPLPGLGVAYTRPSMPTAVTRESLGLTDDGPLLLMPQSLFKVHPEMDSVLADALLASPRARLVLFDLLPPFRPLFEQRLQRAFDAREVDPARVLWLAGCDRSRYLQVNMACDLMLDSLHFSGGNTSLDALQAGLPVLSSEGRFMRGRQTAAMLRRLGLADQGWLAESDSWATRLPELLRFDCLQAARGQVALHLDDLFDAEPARRAWLNWIELLCED